MCNICSMCGHSTVECILSQHSCVQLLLCQLSFNSEWFLLIIEIPAQIAPPLTTLGPPALVTPRPTRCLTSSTHLSLPELMVFICPLVCYLWSLFSLDVPWELDHVAMFTAYPRGRCVIDSQLILVESISFHIGKHLNYSYTMIF